MKKPVLFITAILLMLITGVFFIAALVVLVGVDEARGRRAVS